jgi:hypothetical protein
MQCPMCRRIFSFTVAGGGVPGKADGTAHITMTEVGLITEVYHLFTEMFLPAGEMITEITAGKGNRGSISVYLIRIFNAIGVDGKKTDIGKGKIPGVCKDRQDNINQGW